MNEVKGASLREGMLGTSGKRHQARCWNYTAACLNIIEEHEGRIFGRVWLKTLGGFLDEDVIYALGVNAFIGDYLHLLERANATGAVVLDARAAHKDRKVQRAVLHAKYNEDGRTVPDRYSRLVDISTVGDSSNMTGLQLADVVVSAVLHPIACGAYHQRLEASNAPNQPLKIRAAFGDQLARLQYHYRNPQRDKLGGFVVTDGAEFVDPAPLVKYNRPRKSTAHRIPPKTAPGVTQATRSGAAGTKPRR